MSSFARAAAAAALAGLLPGQAGLVHDVGWLPEPRGPLVQILPVDIDGDTLLDLVRLRDNAVEVLLQEQATGRYQRAAELTLGVAAPATLRAVVAGRFDASDDAFADLAVLWSNGELDLLRGDGIGGFTRTLPRPFPSLAAAAGVDLLVGDVDGNGRDDLVAVLDSVPPQLLLQVGAGAFVDVTATHVPALGYPRPSATLADVDGDLDPDLVLCSSNNLPARLFTNIGGAFFDVPSAFGAGGMPASSVLAVDLMGSALPEVVFGRPGTVANAPVVRPNVGGSFPSTTLSQPMLLNGVVAMVAADVDGDGRDDVVFLESNGGLGFGLSGNNNGVLLGQQIPSTANTEPIPLLSPDPGRVCIAASDLEGDGDDDLVAGGDCPDGFLLHDAGGGYSDVERLAFPAQRRGARLAGALVDRVGNGDLDFVGLHPGGGWISYDNDGSGTFWPLTTAVSPLPPLSAGTLWRRLEPMSLGGPGRRDLLAIGNAGVASPAVALLVNGGGVWVDDTASRFAGAQTGALAVAAPVARNAQLDDLVLGTASGTLELHENVAGNLVYRPTAFPGAAQVPGLAGLVVADFTGDGRGDVLALAGGGAAPKLFVATASGFVHASVAVPLNVAGTHGVAADLDGDGDLDVLLRTAGQPGLVALRWNGASFSNATQGAIANIGFVVEDMAVVAVEGSPHIVLARDGAPDVELAWNGSGYSAPTLLSYRGTPTTTGLLSGDLDRDHDVDLVVLRDRLDPVVLTNTTLHLQRAGAAEVGRTGRIVLRGPPGALAFIAYGARLDTPTPWGLLRLDPATMGSLFLGAADPVTGESVWQLPILPGWPAVRFPMQAAWFTAGGNIRLSGFEHLVVVP